MHAPTLFFGQIHLMLRSIDEERLLTREVLSHSEALSSSETLSEYWQSAKAPSESPCFAQLLHSPQYLALVAKSTLTPSLTPPRDSTVTPLPSAKFYEGLWEYDVFEAFLHHPIRRQYLEIHIAAEQYWWVAEFTDLRVRSTTDFSSHNVQTYYAQYTQHWTAALVLPRTLLPQPFRCIENLEINLCAILAPRQEGGSPRYFSWNAPQYSSPDFHRRELFVRP